jgi:gliding motility-associated-like protein
MLFKSKEKYSGNGAKFIVFILLCLITSFLYAQKEAAVWSVGSGMQFNFQTGNIDFSTFSGNNDVNSTICDKEGNLVLYTNGRTIWNRNNEIVINGEELIPKDYYFTNRPIFIPYPQKDGWYILIYEDEAYKTSYDNTLYYAEINSKANNGRGEVVRKKIKIHDNYHSGPTIAGFCNNNYYWLVIDRNENVTNINRDRIYFYKIDENGVNLTPKINEALDIGNSGGYKFSPNGDKFYFHYQDNNNGAVYEEVADFNFTSGKMYNIRKIGDYFYSQKEFSPNSRLLYFFSKANLIQLDVGYSSSLLIQNSAHTILTLDSNADNAYPGLDLQLAPNGKIYFSYYDVNDKKTKIGAINEPNKNGFACDPETDIFTSTGNNFRMPKFVTSFCRDKLPEMLKEIFADAGPDVEVCSNSSKTIGVKENTEALYNWIPDAGLNDPFSAKTVFNASSTFNDSPQTSNFILRATDGNCWVNFDTINVTTLPSPGKLPIDGSWSVCPFVKEVDYSSVVNKNMLHWLVKGGMIVSDPTNDSIKINWGDTNKNASVSLFSTNKYGCNSDTTVFPVRINVKLITETPKGASKLCIAENKNIPYQVRYTNGSVYNWIVEKGEVIKGQGTNKVSVNWQGDGQHKLIVEESSTTVDTICFGASEPLIVDILNDSLKIKLDQVSYDLENRLAIQYSSDKLGKNHSLFLIVKNELGETVKELFLPITFDGKYIYIPDKSELNTELISLKVINSCNETFYTNQNQTIILQGITSELENSIHLNWNINQFWKNNKLEHEIWYSENGQDGWTLIKKGESGTEFDFQLKGLALTHYFRIKEINLDRNLESWSNKIEIQIVGDLTIPDVITPNGDGINDEWQINNIRFHPFQKIIIYNRFGQVIYECTNEFIPWDGRINGNIIQGTYFYQIIFDPKNKKYGKLTVLK